MDTTAQIDFSIRGLNLPLAVLCAQASADAYYAAPTVYDPATDTSIVITETEDMILIACRGTRSLKNFFTDFDAVQTEAEWEGVKVRVHSGFMRATKAVGARVLLQVQQAKVASLKPRQIIVTGHSLGAAIARQLGRAITMMAKASAWFPPLLYTFGEPRGGNWAYARYMESLYGPRSFRFEHESDLVTRMPWLFKSYLHCPESIFLLAEGGYAIAPTLWRRLFSDVWEFWSLRNKGPEAFALWLTLALADHSSAKYLDAVKALTLNPA